MKINRNYRFILTVLDNDLLASGESHIIDDEICGSRVFASECHYYAEKNILECVKAAEKEGRLSDFFGYTYCIYKENKPKMTKNKPKTAENSETLIETNAMLVEVITIDKNGVNIR